MSEHAPPTAATDDSVDLETGLEALRSSPEFRAPVEPLDHHDHANDHFALIYESREEQFAAAIPFIRHGLERDERCLYVIDENSEEDVLDAMRAHGIDVDTALESGSLSVHTKQETYLRNGTFDPDEMIAFLGDAIDEAQEEYNGLRTAAEMGWMVDAEAEIDALIEYEAKVNRLLSDEDCISLCQYNRERFPADVIRDVINTHPLLVHNGRVSHNVYYTPPEEFFGPNRSEREVDRLLGLLEEQTDAKAELHKRERFLREGYQITADPDLEFEAKLHELLDLARERLGLDAAGLTHLPEWDGKFRIEYALGYGDSDGVVTASDDVWTDPGEGCYCRQVIAADEPVGMSDVRGTDWENDQIHRDHGLSSYLGTRVTIGSRPYGTLWVGGTEPRDRAFTETEKTFLELIGQWVSNELERREHTDAQRALYEVAADPDRSFDEKLDALFDLGRDRFGLDIGGMVEVYPDEDRLEVEHVSEEYGEFEPGLEPPLSGTYCGAAYDADGAVTITDPAAAGYDDGYAYQELGFRAYLGTHIEVDGERDRLFFFTTTEPRSEDFSDAEVTFIELLGEWVRYELERQQREQALRERTEHLNALVETTPDCIKTVARDGTVLRMNPAGLELAGADAEDEVVGECVYDWVAPEDRDRYRAFTERVCGGERDTLEFDIIRADGTRRHMRSHAAPLERPDDTTVKVAVIRDVTAQKERERQLEESERRYRTLVEHFPNGAVALVDENLRYRTVGGDPRDVADVTADAAEGRSVRDAIPPALADELVPRYEAALKDGEANAFEAAYDDSVFEFHVVPVRDDEGDVFAALGLSQDVTERTENKRKLAESERRYRTLVEHFPNGAVGLYDETYTYTAAGGELLDELGDSPDDIVGTTIYERYPDDLIAQIEPHFRAVFDGDANRFEAEFRDRDLVAYTLPVRNADDEIDAGMLVVQDITERKQRERDLAESEHRYRALAENFPNGGVGVYDEDLRYTLVTGTMWDDIDPDAADLEGKTIWECLPPDTADDTEPVFRAAVEDGETNSVVSSLGGRTYRVWATPLRDADGEITGGQSFALDITDQLERERALRESKNQLQALFDVLPVGVVVADADGRLVETNDAAEAIWGGEHPDAASVAEYDQYDGWWANTGDPVAPDEWPVARALRGEAVTDPGAIEIETFDGDRRTVLIHGKPVRDADGEVDRAVGTIIDITEREERKQRLQEQNERLESFASMLAHELRNPVAIGQIYSQQLPEHADTDAVEYVTEAFDRIEDMIDVMLVLTRGREAVDERTPVALAEVSREAWADVDAPEAVFDAATDQIIQADETYIRHLFRNLLENAVEHGGVDVTVEVGELPDAHGFYVADDGPGIPAEDRDRVFDEGYTTASDNGGTGLGLAFVQKLAEVYAWDVAVTESAAGGARFEFRNVD